MKSCPSSGDSAVAGSSGSRPAITVSSAAASATVRASGPAVSWLAAIGRMPVRLTSPTVGFTPTAELATAGLRIEPQVSVPTVTAANPAAAATAEPALDPLGVRLVS